MPETLAAEVHSLVFHNPENGYVIARVKSPSEPGYLTIVGCLGELVPGEALTLTGTFANHPKYGRQFAVTGFARSYPATENGVIRFLASALKGVGPKMAEKLVDRFGIEVLEHLDNEPEKLLAVKGVSKKKLKEMVQSWAGQREIKNLIVFLHEHAVPTTYATRIFRLYGAEAIARISANPYDLAYEIRGVGFKRADDMALKLGFAPDSLERLEAGLLFSLFTESERAGHVFVPRGVLLDKAAAILGPETAGRLDDALALLDEKKRVRLAQVRLPDTVSGDGPDAESIPGEKIQAVYLMHFYKWEREAAQRLLALAAHPSPVSAEKMAKALPEVERTLGLGLSQEQREAVAGACQNKVFIITGGPGTGKTTITKAVVRTLSQLGLKPRLAAPTGRAAKRLAEATGFTALTIHRLLGFSPDDGFDHNEGKKLKADALLIDEASMLDLQLFTAVLRALPLTCRLILVGDVNQLPSVGPGNVLGDLITSGSLPCAVLTHIFRQAQESSIVVNAHRINQGQFPIASPYEPPKADFFFIAQDDPEKVRDLVLETVCERIPQRYGLNPMRDVQVLAPMHKGEVGTQRLGGLIQDRLNPRSGPEMVRGHARFRVGDRVLMLRNNYEKEVFNGDLGWIMEMSVEDNALSVEFDGNLVVFEATELDDLSPAYAISVHKSQGSEYPAVVLPLVTQHFIMLQRNLIYTALTRARRLAVIIGSPKAMNIGLRATGAGKRFSWLSERVRAAFDEPRLM